MSIRSRIPTRSARQIREGIKLGRALSHPSIPPSVAVRWLCENPHRLSRRTLRGGRRTYGRLAAEARGLRPTSA